REEFARVSAGAVDRERARELPRAEVSALAAAGFGALRVPADAGGAGLTLPQAATLWREAAAADSNIPQIFRGQFAIVEDRLHATDDLRDRKSTRLNSSHVSISYAVFCLKKKSGCTRGCSA